jgi:hypothetical protein
VIRAGVVDPPRPVRLDIGEDAVVDLVQPGQLGVVMPWWMVLMSLSGVVRRCYLNTQGGPLIRRHAK